MLKNCTFKPQLPKSTENILYAGYSATHAGAHGIRPASAPRGRPSAGSNVALDMAARAAQWTKKRYSVESA